MVLWRISRHRDLSGTGGLRAAGRWHYAGHAIVYLADSPASSLLEVCVHTSANDVPPEFTLLRVEGPAIEIPSIRTDELPDDWRARVEVTRDLGSAWLERNDSVLLRVPSAIVPQTMNYLFNPSHPNVAEFQIIEAIAYPFDPRLKKYLEHSLGLSSVDFTFAVASLRPVFSCFRLDLLDGNAALGGTRNPIDDVTWIAVE